MLIGVTIDALITKVEVLGAKNDFRVITGEVRSNILCLTGRKNTRPRHSTVLRAWALEQVPGASLHPPQPRGPSEGLACLQGAGTLSDGGGGSCLAAWCLLRAFALPGGRGSGQVG